jgi:alkane 1-monooxygenase
MLDRIPPWALRALAFALPLYTLGYVVSWPHSWPILWILPVLGAIGLDCAAGPERRQPDGALPDWAADLALQLLAAIQLANVGGLALLVGGVGLLSAETLTAVILVGASSGYSAIVVAHELIHRPQPAFREVGRWLMASVCYEHFATEHVRGHHRRVGTPEDPATARFGEALGPFLVRSIAGQLRSAWALEEARLETSRGPGRWLRHRVLQGLAMASALALAVAVLGGPGALCAHAVQAAIAVFLLECVNYVEHWGLSRAPGARVHPTDSWDSESWFTFYTLVGLSRHADHHANAARPWQSLRWFPEAPKMPFGYWGTVIMAIFLNSRLRTLLSAELQRRQLGPFAP